MLTHFCRKNLTVKVYTSKNILFGVHKLKLDAIYHFPDIFAFGAMVRKMQESNMIEIAWKD